ncbi:hypothetical protein ACN47E_006172 [Coniothyrium glycines]
MSGAGPSLHPGDWPSRAVLQFPPDAAPPPIPPPWNGEPTIASPFPIPTDIYQNALSYKVPLTIATIYFVTTTFLNWYNRQHGNKPWAIAKTRAFKLFVISHNLFLAVYSAITFLAMIRCLKLSFPHYTEPNAVVATVDSLCKIHGPRGLGDAVIYHTDNATWSSLNSNILVNAQGLPDSTDVGRIWNEGLAFWGWWFYLSKFYEVVDTAILIVKGKRSTTLQKYHHAGAMLSMWAGMRYMSPPIWTFTTVNSFIHALMYTYYTISALGYRVPNIVKRTLTTMQIMQFILGSTFAALHLFVSYTVPVTVAHKTLEKILIPDAASTVSSVVSSATSSIAAAIPTATGGAALAMFRKLIYRAAGDEGLAENIAVPGSPIPVHQQQHVVAPPVEHQNPIQKILPRHRYEDKIVYRTEYVTVPCIDTSAQAFAIYLNLIYLAPLTLLFMRFFFKSYLRGPSPKGKGQGQPKRRTVSDAAGDASRAVQREFDAIDRTAEDGISSAVNRARGAVRGRKTGANGHIKDERIGSLSPANKKFVDNVNRRVAEELDRGAKAASDKARQYAKSVINAAEEAKGNIKDSWQDVKQEAEQGSEQVKHEASNATEKVKQEVEDDDDRPKSSDSKKSPRKNRKNKNKNNSGAGDNAAASSQNLDDSTVAKPEKEPEPKDINNTLGQNEGKGLF